MPKTIKPETDLNSHLDPDTLGAFAENALNDTEAATMFAHLAECEHCRDWFGVYAEFGSTSRSSIKPPKIASAWFTPSTFYLKTATGLTCAVLLGGLMMLPTGHQRNTPASSGQSALQAKRAATFHSLAQVVSEDRDHHLRASHPEIMISSAERATPLPSRQIWSDPTVAGVSNPVSQSSVGKRASKMSAPSPKFVAQEGNPRRVFWIPFRSLIFTSDFALAATSHRSTLPAPLASARLESLASFVTISPDSQKDFGEQLDRMPLYDQIPLKTTLGVRWISLSLIHERGDLVQTVPEM